MRACGVRHRLRCTSPAPHLILSINGQRCTIMVMTRVASSQLKANLGRYLRAVRAGREIIVTDRDQPVARLVPYETPVVKAGLQIYRASDPAAPPFGEVQIQGVRVPGLNSTEMLRADRDKR